MNCLGNCLPPDRTTGSSNYHWIVQHLSRTPSLCPSSLARGNVPNFPTRRGPPSDRSRLACVLVPSATVRMRCRDHRLSLDNRPFSSPRSLQEPSGTCLHERLLSTPRPSNDTNHRSAIIIHMNCFSRGHT